MRHLVRNQVTAAAILGGQRGAKAKALDRLSDLKVVDVSSAAKPTVKEYVSRHTMPPDTAFHQLTHGLEAKFAASGMKVVRADSSRPMADGERFYIIPKKQPVLMPCRVRIDPQSRKITIETLEHHPFQGTNVFQARSDGKGGTALVQTATFQATSKTMGAVSATPMVDRPQNNTWRKFHEAFSKPSGDAPTSKPTRQTSAPRPIARSL